MSFGNIRNSTSHTFSKNKYMSACEISSSSTFVILIMASELKASALK